MKHSERKRSGETGGCLLQEIILIAMIAITCLVGVRSLSTEISNQMIVAGGGSMTTLADKDVSSTTGICARLGICPDDSGGGGEK